MNEDLLETQIVKFSIERWLREGISLDGILSRLDNIHLIIIEKEDLEWFIETNKLNSENKPNSTNNTNKPKHLNTTFDSN